MTKKINVLQIIPWYPDSNDKENPSRGTFFQEQYFALSEQVNLTVFVINTPYIWDAKSLKDFWHIEKSKEETFDLYKIDAAYIPKCFKCTVKYISLLLSYSRLSNIIKESDLIHAHVLFPSGAIAFEIANKHHKPFVLTEHVSYLHVLLKNNYLKKVLRNSEYMTAVSTYLKKQIVDAGRSQCEVIPNYIDTQKFQIHSNDSPQINLLHISSMADIKNVDILLLGIKKILDEKKMDLRIMLVGGGANADKYQRMAAELNLTNNVTFTGDVPNNELSDYLACGDALIITSSTETFSVVGIEALASGIPVISTKCGGPEDYITDQTGLFIEEITPDAVAKAIQKFLEIKAQYKPNIIKTFCFQHFDASSVTQKIINMYQNLLLNKR